jgi:hypothetical protein
MTDRIRPQFRLHLRSLTERDIAKISAFLCVGHDRFGCDWSVVTDGGCRPLSTGCWPVGISAGGLAAVLPIMGTLRNQRLSVSESGWPDFIYTKIPMKRSLTHGSRSGFPESEPNLSDSCEAGPVARGASNARAGSTGGARMAMDSVLMGMTSAGLAMNS